MTHGQRLALISGVSIVAFLTGYFAVTETTVLDPLFSSAPTPLRTKKVALVIASHSPSVDSILKGVTDMIANSKIPTTTRVFVYNRDQVLLQAQVNEIISEKYTVVYTLGALAAQLTCTYLTSQGSAMSHVYSNVFDPVSLGLINHDGSATRPQSTGVAVTLRNMEDQVATILKVRPNAKNALLVYDGKIASLERIMENMRAEYARHGVTARPLPVTNLTEVQTRVQEAFSTEKYEILNVFRDESARAALPHLIKLCEKDKVTLCVDDPMSVELGAAVGYSASDYMYGLIAGEIIATILAGRKQVEEIAPFTVRDDDLCQLHVNPFALERQGIELSLKEIIERHKGTNIVTPVAVPVTL